MTVRFIDSTLGPVMGVDFNEETSTQIAFIRVKVRISITDRLRFFRRVRFESREGAMIGFEYEQLRRICSNCCRINHDVDHCPFLAPQGQQNHAAAPAVDDEADVLMVPVWDEGEGSNNPTPPPLVNRSSSSDISSHRPISQPPTPASPGLDLNEPALDHHQSRLHSLSAKALSDDSTTPSVLPVQDMRLVKFPNAKKARRLTSLRTRRSNNFAEIMVSGFIQSLTNLHRFVVALVLRV